MATRDGLLQSYVNSRVVRNNFAARGDPRPTVWKQLCNVFLVSFVVRQKPYLPAIFINCQIHQMASLCESLGFNYVYNCQPRADL